MSSIEQLIVVGKNARFYNLIEVLLIMEEDLVKRMEQGSYPMDTNQEFFNSYCQVHKGMYDTEFTDLLDSLLPQS